MKLEISSTKKTFKKKLWSNYFGSLKKKKKRFNIDKNNDIDLKYYFGKSRSHTYE